MKQNPEIVTFGESMALLIPAESKGIEHSSYLKSLFGGAETNVAIGLARLGHKVGWFGHLGSDPFGRTILKKLRGEGVDVSRAQLSDRGPTGIMLREKIAGKSSVYYNRRYSAASMIRPEDLDEAYIASAQILHVTGITMAIGESARATVKEAVRIARSNGVKVTFDPNLRLKLWSVEAAREVLLPLAEEVDIFLPGLDELKLLWATDDEQAIISRLQGLEGVTTILKADQKTYIITKDSVQSVPIFRVEQVVDTVGAGDAFCAGLLSGLLKGQELVEAVRFGNLLGSMAVQVEGDWEGLPTKEEAEAAIEGKAHIER
ncbi:MAG: sugar kinase [Gorillibacterium sp.]|nr:sugar kinase [Gorillibacterium sp.]